MHILLTGGGGFIGRNLKDYLIGCGHIIIAPSSAVFKFEDPTAVNTLLAASKFDAIIHAGFYGISNPQTIPPDCVVRNMLIFKNLTANLGHNSIFINLGSGAEYNKAFDIQAVTEAQLPQNTPLDDYGQAKYNIAQHLSGIPNSYNLRIFGLFGRGESQQRFISYAIKQNIARAPIYIRQNVYFSYLYIEDFCVIVNRILNERPQHRFLNMAPDGKIDLLSIAHTVNKVGGYNSPVSIQIPGLNKEYTANNTLLKQALPGLSFTPPGTAIAQLYAIIKAGG